VVDIFGVTGLSMQPENVGYCLPFRGPQAAQAEGAGRSFHKNSTVQSLLNDEQHNFRWCGTQRGKEETDRNTHVKQDRVFHR
jgi:hypothetical protein